MTGSIFVANGDITQLSADALAYSSSIFLTRDGNLYPAFARHVPGFAELYEALPPACAIGDAFWLPLSGEGQPRGVVVVAAAGGGRSLSPEEKGRRAVRGALTTAIDELRQSLPEPRRLLIALPTFRLGMGGDRNARLASARAQLAAAAEVLATRPAVDVAFIPYTTDSYHVFLQARRDLGLAPPCPLDAASFAALPDALRERRCVLFLGAGLSSAAGLPGWGALVDRLAGEMGLAAAPHADLDYYLDLAQWYVERHGAEALGRLVGDLFGGGDARPTLAHYLLMSLSARVVVTTNYDDLIERTVTAQRRHPVSIVEQKDVVLTGRPDGVCVVKLHGDAAGGKEIVLARDDYDAFFRNRPAMALLLEGLLLNQTFLFVGYGLKDPNFRQIYSRIADMLQGARREAFALTVDAGTATSPFLADQWRRKGLHLLAMPGRNLEERVRASVRFLDWLADRASLHAPSLFLARDVPGIGTLAPLRRTLIDDVGRAVEESCQGPCTEDDARQLAETLTFLTEHGWRPAGRSLSGLWECLADRFTDAAARRRMLIAALQATEGFDAAQRLRERLARVEGGTQTFGTPGSQATPLAHPP